MKVLGQSPVPLEMNFEENFTSFTEQLLSTQCENYIVVQHYFGYDAERLFQNQRKSVCPPARRPEFYLE